MGGEHDARPDMLSFRTTRHSRAAVLAVAAVLICLLLALHRSATAKAEVDACDATEADFSVLSRHARRRRRRELLTQVDLLPEQMARLQKARTRESGRAIEAMRHTIHVARCVVRWPAELEQVERVEAQLKRTQLALAGNATSVHGQLRRRLAEVTSKRLSRGLNKFAGDDFACAERDAHRDAPWARGACLIKCARPRCARAIALCDRLAQCAGVDVNVEGTVATLKRESELSQRTSRRRPDLEVSRVHQISARASDGPCTEADVQLAACPGCCVLGCPRLDCTRAIGLCYERPTCAGVDIGFGVEGRPAVARLRMAGSSRTLG